jgi:hypothetical protein
MAAIATMPPFLLTLLSGACGMILLGKTYIRYCRKGYLTAVMQDAIASGRHFALIL